MTGQTVAALLILLVPAMAGGDNVACCALAVLLVAGQAMIAQELRQIKEQLHNFRLRR